MNYQLVIFIPILFGDGHNIPCARAQAPSDYIMNQILVLKQCLINN